MFKVRSDEPQYAKLWDTETKDTNRYGLNIETTPEGSDLRDKSLNINNDDGIGDNPNRYKQHGFFFNADNCIACHACEAACSEKNDVPSHISFRSVGFVEGGSYPAYQRMNISMACNHCDDPVCLKGCPTRAYTKFAEYGAVLQDPDICFGCGYCTWVCPYNAPQLDPVQGEVSKCNMCVDRLEVGLKPACVASCLGNALDFGVIENTPEGRTQTKVDIPGFPRTDITHPNIRFQQTRSMQREVTRTDSIPVKYHKNDEKEGRYLPVVDKKHGVKKHWNWGKIFHSHENAHVVFTLSAQAVMGVFLFFVINAFLASSPINAIANSNAYLPILCIIVGLIGYGLFKLNMHLGKPHRFYRGFNNLRHSPLSREIAGVSLFFGALAALTFFSFFSGSVINVIQFLLAFTAMIGLVLGSYYMYKLYRIPARPYWNHWQTGTTFYGTMLSLGGVLLGLLSLPFLSNTLALSKVLSAIVLAGLAIETIGLIAHRRYLTSGEGEAGAAHYEQTTTFGKVYLLRNILLGVNIVTAVTLFNIGIDGLYSSIFASLLVISTLTMAYLGRILFYVLVIPTTMPGAFFWKNKGFVEHARETGLADMPQMGVAYEHHHPFKVGELMQTIKENSLKDMVGHMKRILSGG